MSERLYIKDLFRYALTNDKDLHHCLDFIPGNLCCSLLYHLVSKVWSSPKALLPYHTIINVSLLTVYKCVIIKDRACRNDLSIPSNIFRIVVI